MFFSQYFQNYQAINSLQVKIKLNAWKEIQVQKLTLIKKALEELENHADELRKVLLDKEGEIIELRE